MIVKGSKIELIKPMGVFDNIGEVCEVVNLTDDGAISFKFGGCHLGCMSYGEYKEYFKEYIEPIPIKREWSEWKNANIKYTNIKNTIVNLPIQFRDNGLRVQVRTNYEKDNLSAKSSCFKTDIFNLGKGLDLAVARLILKVLKNEVNIMASNM